LSNDADLKMCDHRIDFVEAQAAAGRLQIIRGGAQGPP
jgi:hypothetical protein